MVWLSCRTGTTHEVFELGNHQHTAVRRKR
jgi:hypothetical protein